MHLYGGLEVSLFRSNGNFFHTYGGILPHLSPGQEHPFETFSTLTVDSLTFYPPQTFVLPLVELFPHLRWKRKLFVHLYWIISRFVFKLASLALR